MFAALTPFLVLLVVAVVISYIPMEPTIKKVIYLVIGIIALLMVLEFSNLI